MCASVDHLERRPMRAVDSVGIYHTKLTTYANHCMRGGLRCGRVLGRCHAERAGVSPKYVFIQNSSCLLYFLTTPFYWK